MAALTWTFTGFPTDMVDFMPYLFSITITQGSGTLSIINPNTNLMGLISTNTTDNPPTVITAGNVLNFKLMSSPYRTSDTATVRFTFKDDEQLNVAGYTGISEDRSILLVDYNAQFPKQGNLIRWKKNWDAISYNIYAQGENDATMTRIAMVYQDYYSGDYYQWFLDRAGLPRTKYSVSCIDVNHQEGEKSLPRHAPDIDTNVCLVQGNIADIGMIPVENIAVSYRTKDVPLVSGNTIALRGSVVIRTDTRGYFEFTALQGTTIQLNIDDAGFKRSLLIPATSSADLKQLLAMPQNRQV